MLKKQMTQFLEKRSHEKQSTQDVLQLEVLKVEKDFIEKQGLLTAEMKEVITLVEKDSISRFTDVYIERCDKESEELLAEENSAFLDQPIQYFKTHLNEFMYVESKWFDIIGVDAISFEVDSVFGYYDVMLGIRLPKKAEAVMKTFLTDGFIHNEGTFDLMFNGNEGMWELNFTLNGMADYKDGWTIREVYLAIYEFLFRLVLSVEEGKE